MTSVEAAGGSSALAGWRFSLEVDPHRLVMGIMYLILPTTASFGPITLIVPRLLMALVACAASVE